MIIAACVDEAMGLSFGGRRQSRDRVLIQHLLELSGGTLRVCPSARKLFAEAPVFCGEDWLCGAAPGDWCFCEDTAYLEEADRIEEIVLFQWNRTYPADQYFEFPGPWHCVSRRDFPGSSHEKITVEVYHR